MTQSFNRPPHRTFQHKRRFKETFWSAKARVVSVVPVPGSMGPSDLPEFEVTLAGGEGSRLTFLCDAPAARRWMDRRDAGTFVEIDAREWLRSSNERRQP